MVNARAEFWLSRTVEW